MNEHIQNLIVSYLNDELEHHQAEVVKNWIQESDENAKQFAEIALMHGQMRALLSGQKEASRFTEQTVAVEQRDKDPTPAKPVHLFGSSSFRPYWLSLAAVILVGLTVYFGRFISSQDLTTPPADSFATVVQVADVEWDSKLLNADERLSTQELKIRSGILRLRFDSGVDVTLQGPASYQLIDHQTTKLLTGVLMANVPAGAEGFTVNTPSAQVIDLGTSFGVEVDSGVSDVLVFEGEVEIVTSPESKKRLIEGESLRMSATGEFEVTQFDTSPFEKIFPHSSGISGSSDSFEFVPPWPRRIQRFQSEDKIFVAEEYKSKRLREPLWVNISEPGKYRVAEDLTPTDLARGNLVRSYAFHHAPGDNVPTRQRQRVKGTITFDSPILGVIVLHDELVASSGRFSRQPAGETNPRRQLDLTGDVQGDRIELSSDRKTLTVDLFAPRRNSDLIRVIVDSDIRPRRRNRDRNPNR